MKIKQQCEDDGKKLNWWIPNFHKILLIILVGVLGLLLSTIFSCCNGDMNDRKTSPHNLYYHDTTINKDTCFICYQKQEIMKMIVENKIKHPIIVMKQVLLETGHLTSRVYKENNNCFGFHNGKEYLKFNSIKDCVYRYKQWQDTYYSGIGDYYEFLEAYHYASDTNYVKILRNINI